MGNRVFQNAQKWIEMLMFTREQSTIGLWGAGNWVALRVCM